MCSKKSQTSSRFSRTWPPLDNKATLLIRNSLSRLTGEGDLGAVLRSARTTFGIRIVATVIAYVSMIALARWMGAAEYGIFTYALSWVYLVVMPAGLGIPAAAVRFLPEYSAQQRMPLARGFLTWGITLTLVTSAVIATLGVLALQFHILPTRDAYHLPLEIALAGLPAIALLVLGAQIARAFGWVAVAYSPSQVWHPLLLLIVAAIFVGIGTPPVARLFVPVSLSIAAACVLVQLAVCFRRLRPRFRGVIPQYDRLAWLRVSLPLLLLDGFASLINYSDILMVGFFAGPQAVAFYAAASRTAALVTFFYGSINALSGP